MNKTELVAAMAEQAGVSKKDAEKTLKAFTDVVADELKKGGKIQLVGFGESGKRGQKSPDRQDNEDCSFQGTQVQGRQGFEGYAERIRTGIHCGEPLRVLRFFFILQEISSQYISNCAVAIHSWVYFDLEWDC